MNNRVKVSMSLGEVLTDIHRWRKWLPTALCIALLLASVGITHGQQPRQEQQQSIKATGPGQIPVPVGATASVASDANTAGAPAPAPLGTAPNQALQGPTWHLGHPPERLRFPHDSEVDFTVSAGEKEVKDVRLAQSTLQDTTTFLRLDARQLQLCDDDGKCDSGMDIPANTTRPFTLKISPSFRAPGVFTGEVSFRVAGKPETQSFRLTVYSRYKWAMVLGGVLITAGLGLYLLVNIWLRRSIETEDALFPAYQLRDTLMIIHQRLADAKTQTALPFVQLTVALNELDEKLALQALASHLPTALIAPWSSSTDWMAKYQAYLAPISNRVGAIVVLMNSGVRTSLSYWATHADPVATALGQIDGLALVASNGEIAQAQLVPILQALQAAVGPTNTVLAPLLAAAPAGVVARLFTLPPDTHTLQLRLQRNVLWVWWLVGLIALTSGFYALVLENFGFGSWTDYVKCFFWGLGFSVAGTQLEQLTQASVTGNFGITIPKA